MQVVSGDLQVFALARMKHVGPPAACECLDVQRRRYVLKSKLPNSKGSFGLQSCRSWEESEDRLSGNLSRIESGVHQNMASGNSEPTCKLRSNPGSHQIPYVIGSSGSRGPLSVKPCT